MSGEIIKALNADEARRLDSRIRLLSKATAAAGPPFSPPTKWLAEHYEGLLAELYKTDRPDMRGEEF